MPGFGGVNFLIPPGGAGTKVYPGANGAGGGGSPGFFIPPPGGGGTKVFAGADGAAGAGGAAILGYCGLTSGFGFIAANLLASYS